MPALLEVRELSFCKVRQEFLPRTLSSWKTSQTNRWTQDTHKLHTYMGILATHMHGGAWDKIQAHFPNSFYTQSTSKFSPDTYVHTIKLKYGINRPSWNVGSLGIVGSLRCIRPCVFKIIEYEPSLWIRRDINVFLKKIFNIQIFIQIFPS